MMCFHPSLWLMCQGGLMMSGSLGFFGEYFLEAATSTAISQVALLQEARRKYPALFYSHTLKVDYI